MPLRAVLDDRDVIAGDLDASAWGALRARRDDLRMPCCGTRAVMRVSKLGLRHFAHYTRDAGAAACDWKPESEDHLRAKMEIVAACRSAGWKVQPEARSDDDTWRADVLAWRDGRHGLVRVAFEVQLSVQSRAETEVRQAPYAEAGIRGCWFVRPRRSKAKYPSRNEHFVDPSPNLPAFRLIVEPDQPIRVGVPVGTMEDSDRIEPLGAFVEALLSRRVRFATHTVSNVPRRIRAVFVPCECWRCHEIGHYYFLDESWARKALASDGPPLTACGRRPWMNWDDDALAPDVVAAIRAYLAATPSSPIKLGPIKQRFSKTAGDRYLSFGCPKCGAIYGRHFLFDEVSDYATNGAPASFPVVELVLPPSGRRAPARHWCFPNNGAFCASISEGAARDADELES